MIEKEIEELRGLCESTRGFEPLPEYIRPKFVKTAREAIPKLLDELVRLKSENEELCQLLHEDRKIISKAMRGLEKVLSFDTKEPDKWAQARKRAFLANFRRWSER